MLEYKIIFMHIPKTGGETFTNEIIARNISTDRLLFGLKGTQEYQAFVDMPQEEKENLACVAGHLYFGVHELFDSPCKYLAFVRDPVERIISTYYFTRRTKDHPRHEQARNCSLLEFVGDKNDLEMSDYQVRLLGGNPVEPVGPEELERAKANIEKHFLCVGLTERFDASLLLMAKLLGFSHIFYRRWNVSHNKKRVRPADLDRARQVIRERNQLDIGLYESCSRRLEAQLAEAGLEQETIIQYLRENVAFQESILYEREKTLERQQQEHYANLMEFNQLALVRLLRRLKVFGLKGCRS